MNELIQIAMVSVIVLWSLWLTIKRYLPHWLYAQQQQLADYCLQHKWMWLAHGLQPAAPIKTGCDSGCSSCSQGCPTSQTTEQVVRFVNK